MKLLTLLMIMFFLSGCAGCSLSREERGNCAEIIQGTSDNALNNKISKLIEEIAVRESDVTDDLQISEKKKELIAKASEQLIEIGAPAVPALMEKIQGQIFTIH